MRRRYGNLPIYAKILVPFAVLIIVWGGFGTAILAHGTTSEARARATAQLSTAFDGARATLADDEQNLLQAVRLAANTQGVADSALHRNAAVLRQLLVPLALNNGHDGLRVIDRTGIVLFGVDSSVTPPKILHDRSLTLAPILRAARGESDARGDKFAVLSPTDLLVAAPIRDAKGRSVGAVVMSDTTVHVVARMSRAWTLRGLVLSTFAKSFKARSNSCIR